MPWVHSYKKVGVTYLKTFKEGSLALRRAIKMKLIESAFYELRVE